MIDNFLHSLILRSFVNEILNVSFLSLYECNDYQRYKIK